MLTRLRCPNREAFSETNSTAVRPTPRATRRVSAFRGETSRPRCVSIHSSRGGHMSVSLKSLPFLVACLAGPVTASMAAAQDANGAPRPAAAVLAAKIDSIVQVDVLAQGMPSVSIVVTRGNETLVERAWGLADVANGRKAEP